MSREEALTVVLHKALLKVYKKEKLSPQEESALKSYFVEGYTFVSEEEYKRRVSKGDFKGLKGGLVSVTGDKVNIHTKVGVRQT